MKPTKLRTVVYDRQLCLEAYRFAGIVQPFPNHFHEHYVLGLVETGWHTLCCKNREYALRPGDILLLNPGDSHGCTQSDGGPFAYRAFNIPQNTMLALAEEITSTRTLPRFAQNVLRDDVLADCLRTLHELVLRGDAGFQKEEFLFYLFSALLERCGPSSVHSVPTAPQEVEAVCAFIRQHYAEHLNLEQLCRCAGLSKSTLLRAFVQAKGITPYRYLEAIRIQMARQLLGQGITLGKKLPEVVGADVADQSGNLHLGIIEFPVPILKGTPERLKALREALFAPEFEEVTVVDFSDLAQSCKTYEEFIGKMHTAAEADLSYFGVALCGPKKKVNKLTGNLPLLR